MIRERFRTNYNIYGNSTSDEAGSNLESELETPFNIHMLHIAKQESYPAYVRNLDESTSLQPETNLFEDKLEQESPFRITQYIEGEDADEIAKRNLYKTRGYVPGEASSKYYKSLQTVDRDEIDKEIDRRLHDIIGDSKLVISKDRHKDLNLKALWRQIRDDIMKDRIRATKPIVIPKVKSKALSVVAKSFIAPKSDFPASWVPPCVPKKYDLNKALNLLRRSSENPTSDKKDKKYRLYSKWTFVVDFTDQEIVNVKPGKIETDVGIGKGPFGISLQGTTGIDHIQILTEKNGISFYYTVSAKLGFDPAADKAFKQICSMKRYGFIYHSVQGFISLSSKGTVDMTADPSTSGFPALKIWLNGKEAPGYARSQNIFDLWKPDNKPSMPNLVGGNSAW